MLFALIIISCESSKTEGTTSGNSEKLSYQLEEFNELSTFLILDSISHQNRTITVHFSDTSKFYQPGRHTQFYTLLFLTTLNTEMLKTDVDSVTFDISMLYRKSGDIIETFPSSELLSIIEPYTIPHVKAKIIELNKYNKQEYLTWEKDENIDVILKLNLFFAQSIDPTSFLGADSYRVIWNYEYNKARAADLTEQIYEINKILSDTMYMKEREIGSAVHRILMK